MLRVDGSPPRPARVAGVLGLTVAIVGLSHGLAAAAPCSELPNPIYGIGGSASKPLLGKISQGLSQLPAPDTATLVFQAPGACTGIYGLLEDRLLTGTASYWDATGVEKTCELPVGGQAIDYVNMANSAALCPQAPDPLPSNIGDYEGPVETVVLIAPTGSSQTVISGPAAYLVFGHGPQGLAAPWTNLDALFIRDVNAAVQQLLGLAIRVPASKFAFGTNSLNQNGVIQNVATSTDPEAAIGFVSGSAADAARGQNTIKILAYQHYGQRCGYLPDSSSTSFDKKNVRDGHYYIWTAQHFFAKKDPTSGQIVNPTVRRVFGYITGEVPLPAGFDLLKIQSQAGVIPKCAMKVWREGDQGPITPYTPEESCGHYFDSLNGGTTAQQCTADSECPASAPECNYGYCEVQ